MIKIGLANVAVFLLLGCEKAPTISSGPGANSVSSIASSGRTQPPSALETPEKPGPASQSTAGMFVGPPEVDVIHEYTGGAKKGDVVPIIVAIHGLGDRPASFVGLFRGFAPKAHILVPAGGLRWGSGYAWWPITGAIDEKNMSMGIAAASQRLGAMLPIWQKESPSITSQAGASKGQGASMPSGRVKLIVTGFSQGGMLSFALAATQPEFVGQSIPIAGLLPPSMSPTSWPAGTPKPTIFALHGAADRRVPFELGQKSVESLRALGLTVELKSYPNVEHTITDEMRSDLFNALTVAIEKAN